MNKPLIRVLIALNLLCLIGFGVVFCIKKQNQSMLAAAQRNSIRAKADNLILQHHVASEDELTRIRSIESKIAKNDFISDDDLSWLFSMAEAGDDPRSLTRHLLSTGALRAIRKLHPEQKEKFMEWCRQTLQRTDETDKQGLNRSFACYLLQKFRDNRTIPYVLPLLDSPIPRIKSQAKRTLITLGYTLPSKGI